MNWGYGTDDGPDTWSNNYPHAGGQSQSPIDLSTNVARYDANLIQPKLEYVSEGCKSLVNTGRGYQVRTDGNSTYINCTNGVQYKMAQFHFHWGTTSNEGSEHTVNGKPYAGELHLVHWNPKYKTAADALDKPDGLAVIGIFLKVGSRHDGLQKICDLLPRIRYKSQSVDLKNGYDVASLLPSDLRRYWLYNGSLTTPPCHESVLWLVLEEPIEVSEEQLEAFRQVEQCSEQESKAGGDARCTHNFRPTMPLNNRKLTTSFNLGK